MKRKEQIVAILTAILILLIMQPYYIWGMNLVPIKFILYFVFIFNLKIRNATEAIFFVFLTLVYAIIPVVHGNNIFGFMEFVLLALIPFLKTEYVKKVYKYFSFIYVSLMAISLVIWVLVIIGMPIPGHTIEPLNGLKTSVYTAYPFLIVIFDINKIMDVVRFCSVFDEPGVVGTISLIMLYINGFKMKKKENVILFISGIASFSLFFYIAAFAYLLLTLFKNKGGIKTKVAVIVAGIGILVAVMNIPVLYDMVGYRLKIDTEKGTIVGDNRAHDDLIDYFPTIRGTSKYYWGDSESRVIEFSGSAGYRNIILRFGAVFLALFIVFWIIYSRYSSKKNRFVILVFWTLFIATLYQRPGVASIDYLFLFVTFFKVKEQPNIRRIKVNEGLKNNRIAFQQI